MTAGVEGNFLSRRGFSVMATTSHTLKFRDTITPVLLSPPQVNAPSCTIRLTQCCNPGVWYYSVRIRDVIVAL